MAQLLGIIQDIKSRLSDHSGTFADWLARLNDPEYNKIFSEVLINQYGKFCLFKYATLGGVVEQTDSGAVMDFYSFWTAHNGIYKELRSVTVDLEKVCYVLRPFDKFFNINEQPETKIRLIKERIDKAKSVEFSDKLDGSMQAAAIYEGKIVMSGSSSLNPNASWRLADGYSMLTSQENYVRMLTENPEYTFIFEYISLRDAHVVKYKAEDEGLYLIGVRHTQGGGNWSYADVIAISKKYGVRTTQVFDKTLDEVMSSLGDKRSDEKEGFVLNIDGYFVKIKYDDYVQMHRIISKYSSCNLITKMYIEGRIDDLYAKIPDSYRQRVNEVVGVIKDYEAKFIAKVRNYYDKAVLMDIKDVAAYLKSNGADGDCSGAVFCLLKGKELRPLMKGTTPKKFKDIAPKEVYNKLMFID